MSSASLCREVDCDALDLPYAAGLFVLRRPDLRVPIDRRSVEEHVCSWPIATFRCTAEFGRYRGIADVDQAAPIKLDLRVRALTRVRRLP
jgi:hypothetical protein